MNVSIDELDIRSFKFPDSVSTVNIVLVVAMMMYIVVSCASLTRLCNTKPTNPMNPGQSPLLGDGKGGPVTL